MEDKLKIEESLILMVNHEMICRLCLHSTGAMSDIFENDEGNALKDLIFCATGLLMTNNDNLPSKICHKCRYLVELCCELRNMAMKTHQLLTAAVNKPPQGEILSSNDISQEQTLPATSKQFVETEDLETDQNSNLSFIDKNLDDTMKDEKEPDDFDDDSENLQDLSLKEKKFSKNGFILSTLRHAPPKQLVCQICLSSFSNIGQVQTHVETHYKESNLTPYFHLKRPFECEICNERVSKTQLIQHHRLHLKVNPYVCKHPGCSFVGKNRDSLRHHLVRHGALTVVCERCGAQFRRRWELRQHAARWHSSPAGPTARPRCPACALTFRNAITHRAHMRAHQIPPKFRCARRGCAGAYRSAGALAAHERAHRGERRHRCPRRCGAAYTSRSLLNRHVRRHEAARAPRCDRCEAQFAEYGALYAHRVAAHGHWRPHRCHACRRSYQNESGLQRHLPLCEHALRGQRAGAGGGGAEIADADVEARADADIGIQQDIELMLPQQVIKKSEELFGQLEGKSLLIKLVDRDQPTENSALAIGDLPPDDLLVLEVEVEDDETDADNTWTVDTK